MRLLRRRRLGSRAAEHERVAARLLSHLRHDARAADRNVEMMMGGRRVQYLDQGDVDALPSIRLLDEEDEERLISLAVACALAAPGSYTLESGVVRRVLRRRLAWPAEDVELLFRHAFRSGSHWFAIDRLAWATKAAEDCVAHGGDPELLRPLVRRASQQVETCEGGFSSERRTLLKRLRTLERMSARATTAVDLSLLGKDAWASRVRAIVTERWPEDRDVGALLLHVGEATKGPRPTQAWERRRDELLAATAAGEGVVRALLESAVGTESTTREIRYGGERYVVGSWLSDASEVVLRGAVWAAAPFPWAQELLGQLAEYAALPATKSGEPRSLLVANAAVRTLAVLDPPAVEPLARLVHAIKHRGVRKQVERALDEAAQRAGISRAQLLEKAVESHGLDERGRHEVALGDYTAVLAAVPPGRAQLVFRNAAGKELRSTPAAVRERHDAELRRLRAARGKLDKTLQAERRRLEGLLAAERTWSFDEWERLYLRHGVTRAVASGMIWQLEGRPFLPAVEAPDGGDGEVRLWHPLEADTDEIVHWRRVLLERELVQPFKQAYRETYVVAPTEEETRVYSNRFAAHVLRYPQVYALQKQRGWSGNALGPWDGGFDAALRLEFHDAGVIAEFWIEAVDDGRGELLAELCTTDQVRFYRTGAEAEGPMPLVEVPPRAFSEAMRDVDLFVSVASIGADPTWEDRGEDRFDAYWEEAVFPHALSESARVRRELLADLLPRLAIASRCELGDTYLRVRGDRGSYRIHLSSAAVTMEPGNRFLCIVPKRGKGADVFLPFEGDMRLSEILSKAFMLADDTKIRDRTIVQQLNR